MFRFIFFKFDRNCAFEEFLSNKPFVACFFPFKFDKFTMNIPSKRIKYLDFNYFRQRHPGSSGNAR